MSLLSTSKVTRGGPRASYAHRRILLNHRPLRMNIFDKPNKHPVCKRRVSEHPQISTAGRGPRGRPQEANIEGAA